MGKNIKNKSKKIKVLYYLLAIIYIAGFLLFMNLNEELNVSYLTTVWNYIWIFVSTVILFVMERIKNDKSQSDGRTKYIILSILVFVAFFLQNFGITKSSVKTQEILLMCLEVLSVVVCEEMIFRILFFEMFKIENAGLSNKNIVTISAMYSLFYFSKTIINPLNIAGFAFQALFRFGFGAFMLCFLRDVKSRWAIIVVSFLIFITPSLFSLIFATRIISEICVLAIYVVTSVVLIIADVVLMLNYKNSSKKKY